MSELICRGLSKRYKGNLYAVKDFFLDIKHGEFVVIVGPSGCGKSTILRMIAGLEPMSEGELYMDGEDISGFAPKDRDMAMVFQDYALYPHMTVYDNMAFSLKIKKMDKKAIKKAVMDIAYKLDIQHILDRKPRTLSGGEKQRVAMGRAMIRMPKVFLMDEPLSNLDTLLRVKMRREIGMMQNEMKTTTIYVTHDQTEAMSLGSRIAVMNKGELQQVAAPEELYNRPCNMFVAGFIGTPQMNFIQSVNSNGKSIIVGVRPEDIKVSKGERYVVKSKEFQCSEKYIQATDGNHDITVKLYPGEDIDLGDRIELKFMKIHKFDIISGKRIDS